MLIVLDTSVLVAAMRSRSGASHHLLRQLPSPKFRPALSVALYMEWQAVLTRPEHVPAGVDVAQMQGFLRYLASLAHLQDVYYLWRPFLRDADDDMVLECAVASASRYIITHNTRDFRGTSAFGIQALTPAEFLNLLESTP
ncbi:putative toxin-antitoxin system toxin component, PIN family [Vandammella animalimorsus]|uniref:Putative toxin-antitoxin system toxin component, PIN family n=1 Tax=Vandammella animalimorsus TaxID=2029117 RepID=A0A2A2AD59_9BURK|nr:putative toxin-antitoxin system toxin component, PIN family [Vandammella animalimorsus]PAT35688.1 putative toxin-antitoxin system toxin component, PIN family [Vandammella animalimorsus]PAT40705.1 putative toxin-antitoxin system toxin component, PIN family [Vandammella animalimorsus]RMX15242.1 putative toxin-antitoxin system toxin component, PIN family [Vandammella animalimorsus]